MKSSHLATYWIEYIIRHKGASNLYNPARQLNVIEYYSIDVYVIIYGVLILTITTLRKINRLLWLEVSFNCIQIYYISSLGGELNRR